MSRGTTLFCAGFGHRTRARDLAYEFERFGRLVRCDIPAPKSSSAKPFAFVEFEDPRDAEDAFYDMQGARIDGYSITLQWAKQAPNRSWRYEDERRRDDRRGGHGYGGGRRDGSRERRGRSRSRSRDDRRDLDRRYDDRAAPLDERRSPVPEDRRDDRPRSASPPRREASPLKERAIDNGDSAPVRDDDRGLGERQE
ncbi:UNVERIFIED_CONTAM: hypothetical protein HDU68_007773 [Siphonaria sp. JEL0065]|nr:hypothetical protein HDU68_007773 [Siphonaria sp. JEL0065]